jgi:hypothetical protein
MVLEFRKWLDKRGGGGPTPGDPGAIQEDRRVLLDRYEQHTKHCPSCLKVSSTSTLALQHKVSSWWAQVSVNCSFAFENYVGVFGLLPGQQKEATAKQPSTSAVAVRNSDSVWFASMQALTMFRAYRAAAAAAGAASLLTAAAALASGARLLVPVLLPALAAAAAAACAHLWVRLSRRIEGFHFVDYQHSQR